MFIAKAKQKKELVCNAIYKWTDADVWDFIHDRGMKYNPLYNCGFSRVGCIGCPMASNQLKEFEVYPKYKQMFIKAFERMVKAREKKGIKTLEVWKDGESVFRWWTGDYSDIDGQLSIFDFEEGKNADIY